MLVVGKKTAHKFLSTWPPVSPLAMIEIIYKIAGVVFGVFFQPKFRMFIFIPLWQFEKIGAGAIPFVILPLADVQIALAIPVSAATATNTLHPIADIDGILCKRDRHLQPTMTVKYALPKTSSVFALAVGRGEFQGAAAIFAIAKDALPRADFIQSLGE